MRKVKKATDVDGREVQKGDTVATLTGNMTAKVYDIAVESDTAFLCLRPLHHPFSRGVWHAADHVQRIATAKAKAS
jgi:hypothetical protein